MKAASLRVSIGLIHKRYLLEGKLEMAAGGPGDHPLTDVINYNMDVYGKEADYLLRRLEPLMSPHELREWWEKEIGWECNPESALIKNREQFAEAKSRAKRSGWEV